MPNGCERNSARMLGLRRPNDRALFVIDVHEWELYDDMPVRRCDLTTTMEDFANG